MNTDDLYQDLILDHNKRPRNRGAIEGCDHKADGHNPLCGDRVTIYVVLDGDVITDVHFEGSGCAISTASCSLLTEAVKGKTLDEARALFETFHDVVAGDKPADSPEAKGLGKLRAFVGVKKYPARVKCATLAWHTLQAALEGRTDPVKTEQFPMTTTDELRKSIIKALRTVHDPEIPINLYDLGLIYNVGVEPRDEGDALVKIRMTLTTPNCPVAEQIPASVQKAVREVEGVGTVEVDLVWDPVWNTDMMSEAAKLELEFTGHTGPAHLRKPKTTSLTMGRKKRPGR